MTTLHDFARRVEREVTEAVRLLQSAHESMTECGRHDIEMSHVALSTLEALESDARALSILEETRCWKAPAEIHALPLVERLKYALSDPEAPWYGSDLVSWVADYLARNGHH